MAMRLPRAGVLAVWAGLAVGNAGLAQPSAMSTLTPPANGPRRADSTWFALADCTIYEGPGKQPVRGTIVVRDGRITAVLPADVGADGKLGTADDVPARVPVGPAVIDAQGLHVYPAFIDPYVEVETPAPVLPASFVHWNNAVTPARSALAGPGLTEARAAKLRELGFGAAAIAPDGGILAGQSAVVSLGKPATDASVSKPAVYADGVYQRIALETNRGGGYPNSLMGTISLIRQCFSDADWLAGLPPSAMNEQRELNEAGMLALTKQDEGQPRLFVMDASNELNVLRAAKIAEEFDRRTIIVGSGMEFARLDAVRATGLSFILPLAFPKAPDVASPDKAEGVELRTMMAWEQAPTNPRRLAGAGVEFAFTTNKLREVGDLPKALREAMRAGLAPDAAFAALTTTPAKMLGVGEELGSIEAGKRANLLVSSGPMFDLAAKDSKVRTVYIDGVAHVISERSLPVDGAWQLAFTVGGKEVLATLKLDGTKASIEFDATAKADEAAAQTEKRDEPDASTVDGAAEQKDEKTEKADKTQSASKAHVISAKKVERAGRSVSFAIDAKQLAGALGAEQPAQGAGDAAAVALVGLTFDAFDVPQGLTGMVQASTQQWTLRGDRSVRGLEGVWPLSQATSNMAGLEQASLVVSDMGDVKLFAPFETEIAGPIISTWQDGELVVQVPAQSVKLTLQPRWQDDALSADVEVEAGTNVRRAIVSRRGKNPFAGEWRVVSMDGKPAPAGEAEQVLVKIENALKKDGVSVSRSVSENGKKVTTTAKANDASRTANTITFSHTLKDIGFDSPLRSSDALRLRFDAGAPSDLSQSDAKRLDAAERLDTIEGESALINPDMPDAPNGKHVYVLARVPDDVDPSTQPAKDVPEKLGLPFGPFASAEPVRARDTLLVNATLWTNTATGSENDVVPAGTLVLKGGMIAAIVPHELGLRFEDALAQVRGQVGADALIIDCTGMHVTPGLIDAHSHTGISQGVNEGGQAVTAEVRIADVTNPDDVNWYRQLAGGVTSVLSLHGSANAIGGQSQVNKLRWGCAEPDAMHFAEAIAGIKFALGENPRQVNWEASSDRYPKTRMGVETLIRDRFVAATEYAAARKRDPQGTRRDLELDAIVEILEGKRLVHCHSYRQDEIVMLTHVARDFGFRIGTFQHILEGYKVADYVRDFSGGGSGFTDWWAFKQEVQDAIPAGLPLMQKVGATTSFNSDSNNLARFMNVEAAKAVRYGREVGGFTEAEALRFVTLHPAMQLKVDDKVGRLRPGMDADVAVWTRSPLSTLALVHSTFVDGKRLFSREEDAKLRASNARERARLIAKLLEDADAKKEREKQAAKHAPSGDTKRAEGSSLLEELGLTAEQAEHLRQLYLEAMTSGRPPTDAPGLCGCGLPHAAWSTMR